MQKIWDCKIGEIDDSLLPEGADAPMRRAVREAYFGLTGHEPNFLFSGWGGKLDAEERRVVDGNAPPLRMPADANGIPPAPVEFTAAQLETDPILRYFHYAHLPTPLQEISSAFCTLASFIVIALPRNAERTVALRKLLEAKDAGVRSNVPAPRIRSLEDEAPVVGEVKTTGGDRSEEAIPFKE